jgi:uncharacterized protein YwqG
MLIGTLYDKDTKELSLLVPFEVINASDVADKIAIHFYVWTQMEVLGWNYDKNTTTTTFTVYNVNKSEVNSVVEFLAEKLKEDK